MKGDYSRDTFDPAKHFSRVLMQQGRVQLDADWNEQGAIFLHYLQTLAADLIGAHGGPVDQLGFEIIAISPKTDLTKLTDLSIGVGRYYVDGILCENYPPVTNVMQPKSPARTSGGVEIALEMTSGHSQSSYRHQVNYPMDPQSEEFKKDLVPPLFVYLDVWERHVTAFEDDDIREVALGGPDTAARAKVVWQVKIAAIGKGDNMIDLTVPNLDCKNFDNDKAWADFRKQLQDKNLGMLRARAFVPETSTDVCIVSPEARYRGAENQLYRVEIHRGGTANQGPTFKWSRENGSAVFPIQSVSDQLVTLENMGRDERFGLAVGDWVEVVDDYYTSRGKADPLLRVEAVDPIGMTVTLSHTPQAGVGRNPNLHPLLRRWDQQEGDAKTGGLTLTDGAAHIIERTKNNPHWLNLEDGVQVQFEPGATYRQGDYWLIPARTATGDVEWPGRSDNPRPMPPRGIAHHYAPLGVVFRRDDTEDPYFGVIDLRHQIESLGKCVCPRIEVLNDPTTFETNNPISFFAHVGSSNPGLGYSWTAAVTGGTGTVNPTPNPPPNKSKFTVTASQGVREITATVVVTGLPAGCPDRATGKAARKSGP